MSDMHAALDSSNAESTLARVSEREFRKNAPCEKLTSKYDKLAVPFVFVFLSVTHVSPAALPPHKPVRLCQVVHL